MLQHLLPQATAYVAMMDERPHIRSMMADRAAATTAFRALDVSYEG
jgi:hypothetical protein